MTELEGACACADNAVLSMLGWALCVVVIVTMLGLVEKTSETVVSDSQSPLPVCSDVLCHP